MAFNQFTRLRFPQRLLYQNLAFIGQRRSTSIDSRYFIQGTAKEIQLHRQVPLAQQKYFPGALEPGFPSYLSSPREGFPLVLRARNDSELKGKSVAFWSECFRHQLSLLYKDFAACTSSPVAVLLRGLPVKTTKDFSQFVKGLGFEFFPYKGGGGLRDEVDDFVLTGAGEPPEYTVELHNDMAYSINYPTKFVITCLKKAKVGGETAICDGRELTKNLGTDFVEKFKRKKGIRYLRYFLDKSEGLFNSWQRSLLTENRQEAEQFLLENGYSFGWEGKNLIYWNDASATITHPDSDEEIWFNQAHNSHSSGFKAMPMYEGVELPDHKYPSHTKFADGDEIDREEMNQLRCILWQTAVGLLLEESDVLVVDNLAVLHSRLSYEGERLVRTSILK